MFDAVAQAEPWLELFSGRAKILVVDDDADQRETLVLRLEKQGYEVFSAASADAARQAARTELPNLMLLDVRLPDGDGLELCRNLSDDPLMSQAPIIIVSGMEGPNIVRQARAAGSRFYLRKPYDPNALLLLVEQALRENNWLG